MELWLRVVGPRGEARDVAVEASPATTVGELAAALDVALPIATSRTQAALDPAARLDDAGLRSGDELQQPTPRSTSRVSDWQVAVVGGPASGQTAWLPEGTTVIGRSSEAGVVLGDKSLSRAHLRVECTPTACTVTDLKSANGTFFQGREVTAPTQVPEGAVLELGDALLRFHRPQADPAPGAVRDGRFQFSRPPRMGLSARSADVELDPPPDVLTKRRIPITTSLLPLVAAPLMAKTGGTEFLAIAALSPVLAVASVLEDRRGGGKDRQEKLERFYAQLASTSARMAESLRTEVLERWTSQPDPVELMQRTVGPSARLWERRPGDADFLQLRVGWADQASSATWRLRDGGDPDPRAEAEAELGQHAVAHNVPLVLQVQRDGVVGVAGQHEQADETARWLVAQAAVLHSPRDLCIAAAVTSAHADGWTWLRWLPHSQEEAAPFGSAPLAVGDTAARALVLALGELVRSRREQVGNRLDARPPSPAVLVVIDSELEVPRVAVSALLESGPDVGVKVIWIGGEAVGLPGETRCIVERTGDAVATTTVASGTRIIDGRADRLSLDETAAMARRLAGIRDATARSGTAGDLPSQVTLPDILGGEVSAESVVRRWSQHRQGLGAPIGTGGSGTFSIDMRRDGPHALLGGTTGAGKSEMLQTYVASLAAHIPPTRLTFLLVDYKGGAAFKDCIDLPHVVGFVTDLDGHLVHRALVSLNAELHRRERLLAAVGAKDLIEMERTAPDRAPAALLLVVDEFATLAKELPEFVDGVVNVAQRGRSLGIHMLLATQRPAGAINDNIRANTNLRMALRMNDESDSHDVINDKVAAHLPRTLPGRAFARTGASELTEVQVAYAGGHSLVGGDRTPLTVLPLEDGVVRRPATRAEPDVHDDRPTDLQNVVAAVITAASDLGLPAQPAPWMPALPKALALDDLPPTTGAAAVVGLVDVPARQAQQPYVLDLAADGNALVVGASGAGKTTFLRTLALALARANPPDQLHLYALDFAARGLGALTALPHCGAVVTGDDIERVERLLGLLDRAIAERKTLLAAAGATSVEEYARLTGDATRIPRIVVLLDSFGGFASTFEKVDFGARLESFPQLLSECRPLGIHLVITADRRSSLPLAVMSSVPARIVLRLSDADDYAVLGLDARIARAASLPPGRGFQADTLEVQLALVDPAATGDAQLDALTREGDRLRALHGNGTARPVATLPTEVDLDPLRVRSTPLRPAIGIGETDLDVCVVDLADTHLLVTGPHRSGKSTALAALALGLRDADPALTLHLLAPRRTPLTELGIWTSVSRGADEIGELCQELADEILERMPGAPPVVLVLDDGHELADSLADSALQDVVRRGRDAEVRVIGASEVAAAHRSYGGWLPELRKERHGLLLQPDPDIDGDLLGVRLPKKRTAVPGRGILVTRYANELVQVGVSMSEPGTPRP